MHLDGLNLDKELPREKNAVKLRGNLDRLAGPVPAGPLRCMAAAPIRAVDHANPRARTRGHTHTHTRTQSVGLRGSEPGEKVGKESRRNRPLRRGASPKGEGASPHRRDASDLRRDQRRESKPPNTRLRARTGTDPAHARAKTRQTRSHTRRAHIRARTHT